MDDLCNMTLGKLGDLPGEAHVEMYSGFDVLTEVRILVGFLWMSRALTNGANQISLKKVLGTIDVRIGLFPYAESELMRYCGGVIGKAHADFRAKLLECGPTHPMVSAVLVNGRTEDSEFPNLLLDSGRESYGH